jgi:hypothetical protein
MQKKLDRHTVLNHFLVQVEHFPHIKQVAFSGRGMAFSALLHGKPVRGIVLARSSEYWACRLHLQRTTPDLIVCYQHDSVVPVHVLALEDGRAYSPEDLPGKYATLDAVKAERSRHAAKVFLGALLCGKKAAHDLLLAMPESTRRRYELRMHTYQRRTRGRPITS